MKTRFRLPSALALLLMFTMNARPQLAPEARAGLWRAQWITSSKVPERDAAVLQFRKVFELEQVPQRFVVHVSADNQFLLNANQRDVGRGPARSDLAHWKYETYDLAPFLHAGRNEIAAMVWSLGVSTAAQMGDRIAFVLQGDTAAESAVDTNNTWEVAVNKSIEALPTPPEVSGSYFVAEPAMRIDGALFDWGWNDSASSRAAWEKATSLGNAINQGAVLQNINWQLMADPLPPMQMELSSVGRVVRATGMEAATDFPAAALEVPAHATVSLLLDHSRLTTAYPELTVSGGAKSTVRLTYAEGMYDSQGRKGNRNEIEGKHIAGIFDEFLPDGFANRRFMPLTWRTWRYLQFDVTTADQPLRIENFRSWFTAFPFEERGRFQSDDPTLSQIWEVGWRTARLDAHDTYMDTPYWERLQYIGDTRIQALISYAIAGDDRLARQAIQAFNDSRIPDGLTKSRYPTSITQIIPTFSLLWIGMVHDFWRYRGDTEFIKAQLPGTRTVLDWFIGKQRADGLVGSLPWWPFVDWGKDFGFGMPPREANGGSSVITLQFVEALRYAAALESTFGSAVRAQHYREVEARAVNAVRTLCWNKANSLIADTREQKHYSQHANILGVWLDVIPREQQKNVLSKMLSRSDSGFTSSDSVPEMTQATYYFRFYLARALDHAGMGDQYLSLLKPWRDMLALGLTTWAEQPEPTRSDSHAWSAHPNFDFLAIVAGIRPKAPGFSSVTIEPHLGLLRSVDAAMATPKGMVEVSYAVKDSGVSADINLPANVTGELIWKGRTFNLRPGRQQLDLR